jgi:hypothetical protein
MPTGTLGDRRLELYVRSLSGGAAAGEEHARQVRALDRGGRVESGSVVVWGDEVGLTTTAFRTRVGKCILDRIAAFRAWADDRGGAMAPFFETRSVTGEITGESYTAVRLPVACLAEYAGDDLVHVAPYRAGDADCTVGERLRQLEDRTARPRDVATH